MGRFLPSLPRHLFPPPPAQKEGGLGNMTNEEVFCPLFHPAPPSSLWRDCGLLGGGGDTCKKGVGREREATAAQVSFRNGIHRLENPPHLTESHKSLCNILS